MNPPDEVKTGIDFVVKRNADFAGALLIMNEVCPIFSGHGFDQS
jgi:hypothetical protein